MRKLHHLTLSPFCRKVRLVLAEKKLEVELIDEPVWEKRLDFIRFSPSGKVPLLKEGANVFTESTPICEYLDESHPIPKLIPADKKLRFETRRVTSWFDDKFYNEVTKNLLYERVYKKIFKIGQPDSGAIKEGLKKIKFHFDYLEWLLEKRNWVAGEKMSLADFLLSETVIDDSLSSLLFLASLPPTLSVLISAPMIGTFLVFSEQE